MHFMNLFKKLFKIKEENVWMDQEGILFRCTCFD